MKNLKSIKRCLFLAVIFALIFGVVGTLQNEKPVAQAQDAPSGTFLGTWPYRLLPDHHLNGYAPNGLGDNLGIIYRQIVELTPAYYLWASNEYVPVLATEWGFTEDNTAYSITLRDDATWSDGSLITSDDVVATFALGRLAATATVFNYINDVVKVDDHTVQFVFTTEPSLVAERLILKSNIVAGKSYGDIPQRALELFATGAAADSEEWTALRTELTEFRPAELLASGPYTYTLDDVSDTYMTLHWQPNSIFSSSVQFGEIRLWAGETESTTPLVLSGDIAHSTNVYPPSTQQAIVDAGIRLLIQPRMYGPALLFNHDFYPFNIKEVRQAIAYIIDREESAFLTNGFGATATVYMAGLLDSSVPVLMNQEDIDALNRYEFNPDRATELLESVGFSKNDDGKWADADGNVIAADYKFPSDFVDFSAAAQNAIDQMNEFGFEITAVGEPSQQAAQDIRESNFELSVWSWAQGSPFASQQFFGPTQRFNYVALTDGNRGMNFPMEFEYNGESINLDTMIKEVSNGLDPEAHRARAGEVAKIINDMMPYIPLNVILSTEPWNEASIAGGPADDDPILQNPSSDHFVIWYMLNGMISPAN